MKIAIIGNRNGSTRELREALKNPKWYVDFFNDSLDFGQSKLGDYEVVIANKDLPSMSGRRLIKNIAMKTSAQFFIMSDDSSNFDEDDVHDPRIKGFLNVANIPGMVDHLKYIDAKLRINRLMEVESEKFGEIIPSNGFDINKENGILYLVIYMYLSPASKKKVISRIKKEKCPKLLVSIDTCEKISSPYLGLLITIYKEIKSLGGKIVYLNDPEKEALEESMKMCNLDTLFPIFREKEKAIEYLTDEATAPGENVKSVAYNR